MAEVKSTTYTTNYSATMKDDVLDLITNISPTDNPFMSSIGKTTADSTTHSWPVDSLATPAANAAVEGADIDSAAITPPTLASNYTQILTKAFNISDTAERVKKYGRKSEIKYQTALKLKEIGRDLEFAMVNNATAAAGDATTARTMKGLKGWITTNSEDFSATPAATNLLTETLFNDGMEEAWIQGGKVDCVLAPTKQKRKISAFDGFETLTKNVDANANKVVASVDFYEGDFGTVAVKAHRYISQVTDDSKLYDTLYIIETDLWKLSSLGMTKTDKLGKTGLGQKFLISGEYTLESRQEKGNAVISNLYAKAA